MGSHLSIGKLPYRVPYTENVDVANSNLSAQFTRGTEIILTIEELEILLKAQHIFKKLEFRDLEISVQEAEWSINNTVDSEEIYDEDAMTMLNRIREKNLKRYYSPETIELENSKSTPEEILNAIKVIVEIERNWLDAPLSHIEKLLTWAKKHFIEGEHYLYTL
jgi:hypothetical protein